MAITPTQYGLQPQPYISKPAQQAFRENSAQIQPQTRARPSEERQKAPPTEEIIRPPSTRSSFSVDPARELKAIHIDPKQSLAAKMFVDVAHYEESFHIVDTFV